MDNKPKEREPMSWASMGKLFLGVLILVGIVMLIQWTAKNLWFLAVIALAFGVTAGMAIKDAAFRIKLKLGAIKTANFFNPRPKK